MRRFKICFRVALLVCIFLFVIVGTVLYRQCRQSELNRSLLAAIERQQDSIAISLMEQGANPNARASAFDQQSFWRQLFIRSHRQARSPGSGRTALNLALDRGHIVDGEVVPAPDNSTLIQSMLVHGAEVNTREPGEEPPLNMAAGFNSIVTVRLLIDRGAVVNCCDKRGLTPLMRAAGWGAPETVRLLLDDGANLDATDIAGTTALMWACRFGKEANVQLLVERHAQMHGDTIDNTPISLAIRGQRISTWQGDKKATMRYVNILRMLHPPKTK